MKQKWILGVILMVFILGALVYFYSGGHAPAGQPPLRSLTAQNVDVVKNEFNAAKDDVRVLLLLSPT